VIRSVVDVTPSQESLSSPRQSVDERGLARVKLADYDEQEELFEVLELPAHERGILGWRAETLKELDQAFEECPFAVGELSLASVEYLHLTRAPPGVADFKHCTF